MTDAIAVFARAPVPGQVKTRLAQRLGAEGAAAAYELMLRDTLALAKRAARSWGDAEVWLVYTPEDAFEPGAYSLDFWRGRRLQQCDGDLGARMLTCIQQLQSGGADRVVIIGSDSPHLPPWVVVRALATLHRPHWEQDRIGRSRRTDLVLGPATDGGFYLVGVSGPLVPAVFNDVEWSSSQTLTQVEANASKLRLQIESMCKFDDVDTYQDLVRLARLCPRYRRFLLAPQNA